MGGVKLTIALCAALVCLLAPARAQAPAPLQTLAREKAAAVALLRDKASNEIATVAQGRLFAAYLGATTQGEGWRLKLRIEAAFAVISKRFGLGKMMLIDRGGAVIAGGPSGAEAKAIDVARDPVLKAGFAGEARKASSLLSVKGGEAKLAYFAPVVWRGQAEFVLRAEQDFAAYRSILGKAGDGTTFVVLADHTGAVLADTRPTTQRPGVKKSAFAIAGLPLSGLRAAVKGTTAQGFGEIGNSKERYAVAYEAVGDWVVIAAQPVAAPHRCPQNGGRLCG